MAFTDSLRETLSQIEAHCNEHRIPLFFADTIIRTKEGVTWEGNGPQDWQKFLAILPVIGAKILHAEVFTHNELEDEEEKNEILAYGERLSGDKKQAWLAAYETAVAVAGFVSDITLSFVHENISYEYWLEAESSAQVLSIFPEEETSEEVVPDEQESDPEQQIQEHARLLYETKEFAEADDYRKRRDIAFRYCWKANIDREHFYRIFELAEDRFQQEIQPKIVARDLATISELIEREPGITKAAAYGHFNFTRRLFDHYWHMLKKKF